MSKYAFVMGRNYSARLGMIRAAGSAGYRIIDIQNKPVGTKEKLQRIDASSRFVEKAYTIPQTTHESLIDLVLNVSPNTEEKIVLLPTDDFSAAAIDAQQHRLKNTYVFPHIHGNPGQVVKYMDKKTQKELARKAGFNVVNTWEIVYNDGEYLVPEGITYPVFIKPRISFQGVKIIMQRCESQEALIKALKKIAKRTDCPILVEQFVEIEKELDVPGFAYGDLIHTPGMIEKEIIFRGVTATGTISSMRNYEGLEETIRSFLQQFGFTGLFDLEMYLSKGKIYFNELNLRFGATGYAMTGSGVNMPAMLIEALHGREVPATLPEIERSHFISEKTCLESYVHNIITWKRYKSELESAGIHFIQSTDDPNPWKEFKKRQAITHIKKSLKHIKYKCVRLRNR